jgi:hypothetical protein
MKKSIHSKLYRAVADRRSAYYGVNGVDGWTSMNGVSLTIGRVIGPRLVCRRTTRTTPSGPGKIYTTRPRRHSNGGRCSRINTKSSILILDLFVDHL